MSRSKSDRDASDLGEIGHFSPEMDLEWPIWRLVTSQIATLTEIREGWDWEDIDKANAALSMKYEYEAAQHAMLEDRHKPKD